MLCLVWVLVGKADGLEWQTFDEHVFASFVRDKPFLTVGPDKQAPTCSI